MDARPGIGGHMEVSGDAAADQAGVHRGAVGEIQMFVESQDFVGCSRTAGSLPRNAPGMGGLALNFKQEVAGPLRSTETPPPG